MSTVVLLSWAMALQHHTNRHDIVFGQVLANRNLDVDGIDQMLGCTVSEVPCRVKFDTEMSIVERLQQLQANRTSIQGHCMINSDDHATWSHVPAMQFDTDLAFHRSHDLAMDDNVKINGGCNDTYPAAVYAIEVAVTPTTSGVAIRAAYDRSR
ncbi:hypothetical protein AaE_012170, partial [Aphanomyces astaci]